MQNLLAPGYLRWDGSKFTTDPTVEIVGPPGRPGGTQTLAQTLVIGDTTDGYDLVVTSSSTVRGVNNAGSTGGPLTLSGGSGGGSDDGGQVVIKGGVTTGATGGSVLIYPGTGVLGPGFVSIMNADASTALITASTSVFIDGYSRNDNIDAGSITLRGGIVSSGSGDGGSITIRGGSSPFTNGIIDLQDSAGNSKIQITTDSKILFSDNLLFAQQSSNRTIGWKDVAATDGFDLIIKSQTGNTINAGGNLQLLSGNKGGSGTTDGNISLLANAPGYGGMGRGIYIANATTLPTSDPTGGGFLYVDAGVLKYRGPSGTITTIAPA